MVEFRFNFVGVNTADFRRAFAFYTDVFGIRPAAEPSPDEPGSWAMLIAGWDESPVPDAQGLRCELFQRDVEGSDERWWGCHQNVRPCVQVTDLAAAVSELRRRGVSVTSERTDRGWGESIEISAAEDVRWSIAHARSYPAAPGLRTPHLGWVDLWVADMDAQRDYYTEVMGLTAAERSGASVRLEQGPDEPLLFLGPGGERVPVGGQRDSPFEVQPVWMSFETNDIGEARAWLTDHGVPLLEDVTRHDWGGSDLVSRDADGNPLQVVEYHES